MNEFIGKASPLLSHLTSPSTTTTTTTTTGQQENEQEQHSVDNTTMTATADIATENRSRKGGETMGELDLAKYVGKQIKHYRTKKGLTQNELGKRIGKKNNTISNYETGTISPEQDALFAIANTLDIRVDDLFPPMDLEDHNDNFGRALKMAEGLDLGQMDFLKALIEKTLSMEGEEREKFLESIRFTVEFYEKMNRK